MLGRYTIERKPPKKRKTPLPDGVRQNTMYRTNHCLRPTKEIVAAFLLDPNPGTFERFKRDYFALLTERFQQDPTDFRALRDLALKSDVYIGCNCPTAKNPDVTRCHTYLALQFMQQTFPELTVVLPE